MAQQLYPPQNFAMIFPGVYRSSFPKKKNFSFLKQLQLKTVLSLVLEEYPEKNRVFIEENGIKLLSFGVSGNKEPFADIDEDTIRHAVEVLLDSRNHPVLIHCNKGKHRTGCLVGCLRKTCGWGLVSTLEEYIRFAGNKPRFMDQQFIEFFDTSAVQLPERAEFVPTWTRFFLLPQEQPPDGA